ncbi:hypothetical protein FHETE_1595 [Fusarium heterosporum]|uniref:Uncharacterized protein n=1 Tax=Fusarium heterosporum TaxID=42747 RepID=A0A8H5TSF3_FUSHE|nr:hypothetical protein FHETE_1595 [Fusarium heterosporum]
MSKTPSTQASHGGRSSSNIAHQNPPYSMQMNSWMQESNKEMPWNNILSVAAASMQNNPVSSPRPAPSSNVATQGSAT